MTERDTRPDAADGTDGASAADLGTTPPAVPTAFGSAPAGWAPSAAPDPTAAAPTVAEPAPATGTQPLPPVPSRRSLRGKPPVSTAAIPVVRPAAPGDVPGAGTVPGQAPTGPTFVAPSEPTLAAAPRVDADVLARGSGPAFTPDLAPTTGALPRRGSAAGAVTADPATPARRTAWQPAASPVTPTPAGSAPDDRAASDQPARTDRLGGAPVAPAASFDQTVAGQTPVTPPESAAPPAWHPITGATPIVPKPEAPWQPVTGSQPVVPPAGAVPTPAAPDPAPVPSSGPTTAFAAVDSGPDAESTEPVDPPRRSRRGLWITLIVLGVLVLGGAGAGAWYLLNRDEPTPTTEVVTAPSPTSAVTAIDRTATTAFAANLPATVLQYALSATQDDPEWVAAGALESYLDTYTDASGAQLTVHSGQWATATEADAQQSAIAAALTGEVLSTSPVTVGGEGTGTVTMVDLGDGTGAAVWDNGTAVFVLTAPLADLSNAFAAYPV